MQLNINQWTVVFNQSKPCYSNSLFYIITTLVTTLHKCNQSWVNFNCLILSSLFYVSLFRPAFYSDLSCILSGIFLFMFVTSSGTKWWIELLILHVLIVFLYTNSSTPRNLLSRLFKNVCIFSLLSQQSRYICL